MAQDHSRSFTASPRRLRTKSTTGATSVRSATWPAGRSARLARGPPARAPGDLPCWRRRKPLLRDRGLEPPDRARRSEHRTTPTSVAAPHSRSPRVRPAPPPRWTSLPRSKASKLNALPKHSWSKRASSAGTHSLFSWLVHPGLKPKNGAPSPTNHRPPWTQGCRRRCSIADPTYERRNRRLRESLAQTDATRLSFYPNLSLTGSVGTASTGLSEIISNPLGSLAASLSLPFIQLNQAHFATALARTQYDQAVLRFKKTLWQALSDVDNALSARTQLEAQRVALARSLAAACTAQRLTEIRYRAGAVSIQAYLDAKASRRQAELVLSANRLAQLENYAALCQALGGAST